MNSSPPQAIVTSLIVILTVSGPCRGQAIGIRFDTSVLVDVETTPTEQFWVTESPDLSNWTNHSFVDHSSSIDCGPPSSERRFYRLEPLYGPITWTQLPDMPLARDQFTGGVIDGTLPPPIFVPYSSACPVVNGKVVMAGGLTFEQGGVIGTEDDIILSNLVTVYDTQQDAFSHNATLLQPVRNHLFLLGKDRLYVLGGTVGPYTAETLTATMFSGVVGD
jgi:hypothetical protein